MFVSLVLKGIANFLLQRRTMRELATLDDRQLADIGITRSQIKAVAAVALSH